MNETTTTTTAPALMNYDASDINEETARRAYSGTSFSPEKRAARIIAEYVEHMQAMEAEFTPFVTDANREELAASLEAYKKRYIELLNAYLYSHANVMSTMITGPANFPTARNRKRSDWAMNHLNKWLDWSKAAQERLHKRYNPREIARAAYVVRIGEADAVERMQAKIEKAESLQELMKAANKIAKSRRKGYTEAEKIADLQAELGISERTARDIMTPDYAGRVGFASYQLTNNGANIRRMQGRLVELKRLAEAEATSRDIAPGVTLEEAPDDGRIRLFFPGKPSPELRGKLKSHGFRWAPSVGAWQRMLNSNGRSAARQLIPAIIAEYAED